MVFSPSNLKADHSMEANAIYEAAQILKDYTYRQSSWLICRQISKVLVAHFDAKYGGNWNCMTIAYDRQFDMQAILSNKAGTFFSMVPFSDGIKRKRKFDILLFRVEEPNKKQISFETENAAWILASVFILLLLIIMVDKLGPLFSTGLLLLIACCVFLIHNASSDKGD
jgi:hypothetical protein